MRKLDLEDVIASLASHTNDAIVITEAEPVRENGPVILWVNKGFTAMTGFHAEEIIGRTPRILQRDDVDPIARERIYAGLKRWQPVRETLKNYRKDGTPFWVELNIKPVADEFGWYHYWVAVQRDVTSQVVQTRALETALEEANAAARAQVAFLSAMNHELRTPLNGILGMAQIIPRLGKVNEAQQNALDAIITSGRTLESLVENVFDLVEVQSSSSETRVVVIDIRKLVEEAIDTVRDIAESKGIEIFRSYSIRMGAVLHSDPNRLKRVFINLLSNAVKFTDDGNVVVKVRESGSGFWEISVEDTGIGIDKSVIQKLFDPFFQVSSGTTRSHDGAGLGLSVVRRFVEMLSGQITVETHLGSGSKFIIRLPSKPASIQVKEGSGRDALIGGSRDKVLIIQNDALERSILKQAFRINGWDTAALTEWSDFSEKFHTYDPHVVVLDRHLGASSGEDILVSIRARADGLSQVPVIMLTADVSVEAREHAMSLGASQFFSKPVDIDSLVKCATELRSVIGNRLT